jgi:His-Xaa-Ser system protein HxsD
MADEVSVEFDGAIQSLDALRAAAYRLVNLASCQIDRVADRFICKLTPRKNVSPAKTPDAEFIRLHFIDLVTDENLRERVSIKTEPVRNLILSLAFGSLAAQGDNKK